MHWLLPFSTQLQVKRPELLLHTYGREHRVALIMSAGAWHTPERHQAITVKLVDVAPMVINDFLHNLPFYQFTQPSVAVSPFSGNFVDFFDSFSVRFLRGQGPQNATPGDRDSSPDALPHARAADRMGPSPAARRPPRWLSTATRPTRPN